VADAKQIVQFLMSSGERRRGGVLLRLQRFLGANAESGLDELARIDSLLTALGVSDEQAAFDTSIVRGLEYYTGVVFEAALVDGEGARFGSVGGGGRYDDLVARFTGQLVPATGFSVGVSRLAAALAATEQVDQGTDGPIVVLPFDKEGLADCFVLAGRLRAEGLCAEVYLGASGPKAQLKYSDKRNAPIAVILGADERRNAEVTLKDLKLGAEISKTVADNREWREGRPAQVTVKQDELISAVRRILHGQRDA
jgi:histidyl-tRNA synthetase